MDLQRTGVLPAQPNAAQVQALHALENIQGAVHGADGRMQQAYDATIRHLQEALNQSEANNRLLSEQNVRQNQRIVQLEQQFVERKAARKVTYQAVEERFVLQIAVVIEKLNKISTHPTQALDCVQASLLNAHVQMGEGNDILHCPDGYVGTLAGCIPYLMEKIDVTYRERVKANNYSPKIICDETTSMITIIKQQLLDIQAEYKRAMQNIEGEI